MTLREFITHLNEFVDENPETLEMEVIIGKFDETNDYNYVFGTPRKGYFEDNKFTPFHQYQKLNKTDNETNSVCLN